MVINKKSQGSPIGLIVAAVIGLIILVVVIAMIGGKLGAFGKGADQSAGDSAQKFFSICSDACKLFAKEKSIIDGGEVECKAIASKWHPQVVPGSYSDIASGKVCCCRDPLV